MFALDNIEQITKKLVELLSNTSIEDINQIPAGFNNNIAWNFGHIATSSYSLAFKANGADSDFQIPHAEKYKKGSRPESITSQQEIDELIDLLNNFPNTIKAALAANRFENVKEYTTGTFGVPITNIQDMLITIAMHNTLHWQTIKDLKSLLNNKS